VLLVGKEVFWWMKEKKSKDRHTRFQYLEKYFSCTTRFWPFNFREISLQARTAKPQPAASTMD
jgi:hypothetical protein